MGDSLGGDVVLDQERPPLREDPAAEARAGDDDHLVQAGRRGAQEIRQLQQLAAGQPGEEHGGPEPAGEQAQGGAEQLPVIGAGIGVRLHESSPGAAEPVTAV